MVLSQDFGRHVTQGIHFIWLQVVAVGIGSVYFHATLTLVKKKQFFLIKSQIYV